MCLGGTGINGRIERPQGIRLMAEMVDVKYDEFIYFWQSSWEVRIDKQCHYFPYSLCELDEVSKVIRCPLWLVVEKELEDYIDG